MTAAWFCYGFVSVCLCVGAFEFVLGGGIFFDVIYEGTSTNILLKYSCLEILSHDKKGFVKSST